MLQSQKGAAYIRTSSRCISADCSFLYLGFVDSARLTIIVNDPLVLRLYKYETLQILQKWKIKGRCKVKPMMIFTLSIVEIFSWQAVRKAVYTEFLQKIENNSKICESREKWLLVLKKDIIF